MLQRLIEKEQSETDIITTYNSETFDLANAVTASCQLTFTVSTPANKNWALTDVNTTDDEITIASHGFTTGLAVTVTTAGSLPTGLALATTYYVIVIDENTIQMASSLANALAGTAIDLTAAGSGTSTVVVTALAGASVILRKSNDGVTFSDEGSATNITTNGTIWLSSTNPTFRYLQYKIVLTSGQLAFEGVVFARGYSY